MTNIHASPVQVQLQLRRAAVTLAVLAITGCAAAETPPAPPGVAVADTAPPPAHSVSGSYLAARHAQIAGDLEPAIGYLQFVLSAEPDNAPVAQRTFRAMLQDGRVAEAVGLLDRLPNEDATGLTRLTAAVDAARRDDFAAAVAALEAMADNRLNRVLRPLLLAWAQLGQGDTATALGTLARLDDRSGLGALHDLHAGLINEVAGRRAEAGAAYRKAYENSPRRPLRLVLAVAGFLARDGRGEEAAQIYRAVDGRDFERVMAEDQLVRLSAGLPVASLAETPRDGLAQALFDIASALQRERGGEAALIYANLALHLRPDFPLARLLVAEIFDDRGQHERALAVYRAIDRASPYGWMARMRAASNLQTLGRHDEAEAELRALAERHPDRADPLFRLGDMLRSRNHFAEAVAAYDEAIGRLGEVEPRHWSLFYARGIALERAKLWPRAEADFLKALTLQPEQPYVMNYLGYSWIELGINVERARALIERAVELRPEDGYIVDSLGWVLYKQGDFSGAVRHLERAVELRPTDPVINDHLGDAYWKVGRRAEARFQWSRALSFGPEPDVVAAIRNKLKFGLAIGSASADSGR